MWDIKRIYAKKEEEYAFTKKLYIELVEKHDSQKLKQGSAIEKNYFLFIKIKYCKNYWLKKKLTKINRIRNGYIDDKITSVDIQGIKKRGGKIIQIYERVFYSEIFKTAPFRKFFDEVLNTKKRIKKKKKRCFAKTCEFAHE